MGKCENGGAQWIVLSSLKWLSQKNVFGWKLSKPQGY